MAEQYHGMAIGIFELDSECACFVALVCCIVDI